MSETQSETRTLRVHTEDIHIILRAILTARAMVRDDKIDELDSPVREIEQLSKCLSNAFVDSGPVGARYLVFMTYHHTHEEHFVDVNVDAIEAARSALEASDVGDYDAFSDLRRMLEQRWYYEHQRG